VKTSIIKLNYKVDLDIFFEQHVWIKVLLQMKERYLFG
jgi:hypothetical protein